MAILTRPLLKPQARWDLEDFNLALSALRTDSHFYTNRFLSNASYIMQGFTISNAFIGQPTADLSLTNATLINANNTGDVSWWTAPSAPSPITIPTGVGGLQAGRNYLEIEVFSQDGTPLQRAFWDPSSNSGQGSEFTQEVDTVTEMFVRVHVSQTGFTTGNPNLIQIAIIDLDNSLNIKGIQDERKLFYRLGQPEAITAGFAWNSKTEPPTTLTFNAPAITSFQINELITFSSGATAKVAVGGTNNIQVYDFSTDSYFPGDTVTGNTSGASALLQSYFESFTGADKDIKNFRDLIAALMTEIRAVKGTRFWYEVGGTSSLATLLNYVNCILTPLSAGARFSWSGTALKITDNATINQATSDELAAIRVPGFAGNLILTRQDGTGGSTSLSIPDGYILYVALPMAGSSRTYSESGNGVTNYHVTSRSTFIPADNNFILGYREGQNLIIPGTGKLESGEDAQIGDGVSKELLAFIGAESETSTNPQYTTLPSADLSNQFSTADSLTQATSINAANINDISAALLKPYQERLTVVSGSPANDNEVQAPISSGDTFIIPLDSRNSNIQKTYTVGLGSLMVFLNGQALALGEDYLEVGSNGTLSQTIEILQDLVVGDDLDIRILTPQYFGTVGQDQPFFVNYIVGQNGFNLPVGAIYNVGTDRLQIWRDGLMMLKTNSAGDLVDRYQEDNSNSIALSEAANSDEVFIMVNHETPNPNVTLLTGITGTVLTVPTYTIGNGGLRIFRNGVLLSLNVGADSTLKYSESSTTTVTLSLAALSDDVFKVYRSGVAPTWRESITSVTGTAITIPNSRTFTPGSPHLLVFRNGLLMVKSTVISQPVDRYQESGNDAVTLELTAVNSDLFEFIYV